MTSGLYGQNERTPGKPLAISTVSRVSPACGTLASPLAMTKKVEARLQDLGMTVSSVHTAQLAAEVECVPATRGVADGMAIHHCLGLSEPVFLPSDERRPTLASTWRKCESYTCVGANCGALVRSKSRKLMAAFIADYQKRRLPRGIDTGAEAPKPEAVKIAGPMPPPDFGVRAPQFAAGSPAPRLALGGVVFYALYILTCLTVMFYWQWRPRAPWAARRSAGSAG